MADLTLMQGWLLRGRLLADRTREFHSWNFRDEATTPSDSETIINAAEGVCLAVSKGVALLFVPGRDGLFEVDPFVAGCWRRLQAGMSVAEFLAAAEAIHRDGRTMLADLREAGAIEYIAAQGGIRPVSARLRIDLGSVTVSVNFCGSADFAPLRDMVAHLDMAEGACDRHLLIVGLPGEIGIARSGQKIAWYPWEQAAPALKMALTDLALEAIDGIALHVATLSEGEEHMLLVGEPGAGKSTLAVALAAAGFRLEGDDIADLQRDGRVMALPFPATVKDGAWGLLTPYRSDLALRRAYKRPDDQSVRYLGLDPGVRLARRVRTVLCVERTDAAPPALTPLGLQDSIAALLAGAWSATGKLAPQDFGALVACASGASFYRMTYNTLAEGISLAKAAWCRAEASIRATPE